MSTLALVHPCHVNSDQLLGIQIVFVSLFILALPIHVSVISVKRSLQFCCSLHFMSIMKQRYRVFGLINCTGNSMKYSSTIRECN